MQLLFSTGNNDKFLTAQAVCAKAGISLVQKDAAVIEIQSEDPQAVALDKALKSFQSLGQPLVITDDSWAFAGLNGFPGVYMHSINSWFSPEDFLHLTLPLKNRTVTLTQHLVYIDGQQQKVFTRQTTGALLTEARGTSRYPSHTIITLEGDKGRSIAETFAASDKSTRQSARVWDDFVAWYTQKKTERGS
jgi:inosine/xanthosine triphosphate pyrophosphatase family protein